jgi:two-component system nitrogen regulation response regulator NtrX
VDVRVIAATNKDLRQEIARGNFREDLYHRLAVIVIQVPSLNERKDDIPELVKHFIAQVCDEYNVAHKKIEPAAIHLMQEVDWTGNIRELRNVVERLIILSGNTITAKDVQSYVVSGKSVNHQMSDLFSRFQSLEELQAFIVGEYQKYKSVTV